MLILLSMIRGKNEALKNRTSKALLSASKSENMQVTGNTILIFLIDCSVITNRPPDGLLNGDIQS